VRSRALVARGHDSLPRQSIVGWIVGYESGQNRGIGAEAPNYQAKSIA
jgi:hypothetical protein